MVSEKSIDKMGQMFEFLDRFILFHLGRDAQLRKEVSPSGRISCFLSHPRIRAIRFELDPEVAERFSEDIPAFEDYLLDQLTRNRSGLEKEGERESDSSAELPGRPDA
jgi:hypothetical protein